MEDSGVQGYKAESIIKSILELANSGKKVSFESDWGNNTLTVYIDDAHSHVGVPDGSFDVMVDGLYGLLVKGCGLSFSKG